jgi:hypothetical protein
MNITPTQRAQLEDHLKQIAAWKLVLGENAERFVIGDRIMGVPCSALALEALTDFIYPDCPVGDNDYTDANHVMIMRAFERALINPKVNKSLAAVLRLMRAEPKWAAAERGKKLANLEPLQNKASVEQLGKAAKDVIRPGPTRRFKQRFLVCLAFSYLYERKNRLPTQREVLDYINERPGKRKSEKWMTLSSLQHIGKFLRLKFGHATYRKARQRRRDWETVTKALKASLNNR